MRALLSTSLAVLVVMASVAVPVPAMAQQPSAEALFDEGRKAYRLGKYEDAVKKWEESYSLSNNALILYNIGLAYKGWYSVSGELAHLRKAKAVFNNFYLEAQRDPSIGDPTEAESQIKELDTMIAKAEQEAQQKAAADAQRQAQSGPASSTPLRPTGPDPGKKLRLPGVITMGIGGALVVTGGVMGLVFALKGEEFQSQLSSFKSEHDDLTCDRVPADPDRCDELSTYIKVTRDNGNQANVLAAVSLAALGGIGVAALVAGGVTFAYGNKRTRAWEQGRTVFRVLPTWGGLVLHGRF